MVSLLNQDAVRNSKNVIGSDRQIGLRISSSPITSSTSALPKGEKPARAAKREQADVSRKVFNYNALSNEQRVKVEERTESIRGSLRSTALELLNAGRALIEVKKILPHGQFLPWLKLEFEWSASKAKKLMQVAARFKSVNFTDLKIDPSALYLLTSDTTPDEIRGKFIKKATRGDAVRYTEVKTAIDEVKKAAADQKVSGSNSSATTVATAATIVEETPSAPATGAPEESTGPRKDSDNKASKWVVDLAKSNSQVLRAMVLDLLGFIDSSIINLPEIATAWPDRHETCELIDSLRTRLSEVKNLVRDQIAK